MASEFSEMEHFALEHLYEMTLTLDVYLSMSNIMVVQFKPVKPAQI